MPPSIPRLATAALLALLAPASGLRAQNAPAAPEVTAQLISNLAVVGGGEDFEVAVLLGVPEGCHISWSNPGDLGMATQAKLKGPAGFVIDGPHFPGPREITGRDGLSSYGYTGEVALFFKVKVPRGATSGHARFSARVDWQLSGRTDVLGKAEPALSLPLGSSSAPASGSLARRLDSQREFLPRRWKEIARAADPRWTLASEDTGEGAQIALEFALPQVERLTYFPSLDGELVLLGQEFALAEQRGQLKLLFGWLPEGSPGQPRARGVLRVERGLELVYYEVDATGRVSGLGD